MIVRATIHCYRETWRVIPARARAVCDGPPIWAGICCTLLWHPVSSAATQQEYDRSKMADAFHAPSKTMRHLLLLCLWLGLLALCLHLVVVRSHGLNLKDNACLSVPCEENILVPERVNWTIVGRTWTYCITAWCTLLWTRSFWCLNDTPSQINFVQ